MLLLCSIPDWICFSWKTANLQSVQGKGLRTFFFHGHPLRKTFVPSLELIICKTEVVLFGIKC